MKTFKVYNAKNKKTLYMTAMNVTDLVMTLQIRNNDDYKYINHVYNQVIDVKPTDLLVYEYSNNYETFDFPQETLDKIHLINQLNESFKDDISLCQFKMKYDANGRTLHVKQIEREGGYFFIEGNLMFYTNGDVKEKHIKLMVNTLNIEQIKTIISSIKEFKNANSFLTLI